MMTLPKRSTVICIPVKEAAELITILMKKQLTENVNGLPTDYTRLNNILLDGLTQEEREVVLYFADEQLKDNCNELHESKHN